MMGILDKLFGTEDDTNNENNQVNQRNTNNENDEATLQLRKEELDINKNKVQAGEVILGKQVVEDQQTVNVPVTHEELVIERRPLNNQACDTEITSDTSSTSSISDNNCETIRIPLTEEQVDVNKKTVVTEEITAYKRDVEENKKIEETLKREEARIDKNGNAIINDNSDNSDNTDNNTSSFQ